MALQAQKDVDVPAFREPGIYEAGGSSDLSSHDIPLVPLSSDPDNWSRKKRWIGTMVAVWATYTTIMNGTIITVAHKHISDEFHVDEVRFPNFYWVVTSWALGGAIFPLIGLPLIEDFGVRPGFLSTYVVFLCFIIPQALAKNFATLIVSRFFAGGCSLILANTSISVITNIWKNDDERKFPVNLFIAAFLAGSSSGPIIGAVILQYLSWRWIGYLQLIWFGAMFPLFYFMIPETVPAVIQRKTNKASSPTSEKAPVAEEDHRSWRSILLKVTEAVRRPMYMLFTEPVLLAFTIWASFMIGTVYMFTQSVGQVFSALYGWTTYQIGYVQSAVVIGEIIGCLSISAYTKFISARNGGASQQPIPETKLYLSVFGSFVGVTGGMFIYAWTSYAWIPWIAPTIGLAMVGYGANLVIAAISDYIMDVYSKYAGSAMAAIVFGENLFAALLPLSTYTMYRNLGFQWASTLLAFIALVVSFAPVCLLKWGPTLRAKSPFMRSSIKEPVSLEHV
ncbi:MFS general substrate transporter, partial [Aureobasidium melanogenum]